MTSLAAANVGIPGRGVIRAGFAADLVLFDARTVVDHATIKDPHAMSQGIVTVWVNGDVVFDEKGATGKFPGKVLRKARRAHD